MEAKSSQPACSPSNDYTIYDDDRDIEATYTQPARKGEKGRTLQLLEGTQNGVPYSTKLPYSPGTPPGSPANSNRRGLAR
eukprot:4048051-Pyramimonas_sp.AAC.1